MLVGFFLIFNKCGRVHILRRIEKLHVSVEIGDLQVGGREIGDLQVGGREYFLPWKLWKWK